MGLFIFTKNRLPSHTIIPRLVGSRRCFLAWPSPAHDGFACMTIQSSVRRKGEASQPKPWHSTSTSYWRPRQGGEETGDGTAVFHVKSLNLEQLVLLPAKHSRNAAVSGHQSFVVRHLDQNIRYRADVVCVAFSRTACLQRVTKTESATCHTCSCTVQITGLDAN